VTLRIKNSNILEQSERIAREMGSIHIDVYLGSSSGQGGVSRSGVENKEIADKQIEEGRDPWFLGRTQKAAAKKILDNAIKEIVRGGTSSKLAGALDQLGKYLVFAFRENIDKARSRGGKRMRGNNPTYRKLKIERFGSTSPLRESGALRASIMWRVNR